MMRIYQTDQLSLDDGKIIITYPCPMTRFEFDDFRQFLALIERKLERLAILEHPPVKTPDSCEKP